MLELSSITLGKEDPRNDAFVEEFGDLAEKLVDPDQGSNTGVVEKSWGMYWTIALAAIIVLIFSPIVNLAYTYKAIISVVLIAVFWLLRG